jgi:hypothetical protein
MTLYDEICTAINYNLCTIMQTLLWQEMASSDCALRLQVELSPTALPKQVLCSSDSYKILSSTLHLPFPDDQCNRSILLLKTVETGLVHISLNICNCKFGVDV